MFSCGDKKPFKAFIKDKKTYKKVLQAICDALDQYGGVDSGNDASVLLSDDEGDDKASVASSQRDYHVNVA